MKSFFQRSITTALLACALLSTAVPAQEPPTADELLKNMRDMTVSQGDKDVAGVIRKGRTKTPFSLSARGETLVFQYKENNTWKRFDARIREKEAQLVMVEKGKATVMAPSSYTRTISGTDVCYEDLSLRFLYWKGGKVLTDSTDSRIKGQDCHVLEIPNPNPAIGQFAWVRLWVDKDNGTTWQIDGYGRDGKLKKRFTIVSVQKLNDGSWFFKTMKLEIRNPKDPSRTISLNYLEMDDLPSS